MESSRNIVPFIIFSAKHTTSLLDFYFWKSTFHSTYIPCILLRSFLMEYAWQFAKHSFINASVSWKLKWHSPLSVMPTWLKTLWAQSPAAVLLNFSSRTKHPYRQSMSSLRVQALEVFHKHIFSTLQVSFSCVHFC